MKKLNADEARNLIFAASGRTTKISAMTSALQVGEGFTITRADWNGKKTPYEIINRVAKKTGRTFSKGRTTDGIKRIS